MAAEQEHPADIIAAEYTTSPLERPGMFTGRPWVIYYEGATRRDCKLVRRGIRSFETEAEAHQFRAALGHDRFPNDGFVPF